MYVTEIRKVRLLGISRASKRHCKSPAVLQRLIVVPGVVSEQGPHKISESLVCSLVLKEFRSKVVSGETLGAKASGYTVDTVASS
jgi:hypothetical protein